MAYGIVAASDPRAAESIYFPMSSKREDVVTSTSLKKIEKALPGFEELLLKKIRPVDGATEALWAFNRLHIHDKHRLLVPTVTMHSLKKFYAKTGGTTFVNCDVGGGSDSPHILLQSDREITVEDGFELHFSVEFGHAGFFENKPVIPTLLQIGELVTDTLDKFEWFIRNADPSPVG